MLATDHTAIQQIVDSIKRHRVVAFDTESTGLDWTKDEVVGYSLSTDDGSWFIPTNHPECSVPLGLAMRPLRYAFSNPDINVEGHHLKFDLHNAALLGVYPSHSNFFDTCIAAQLVDENRELGLKDLALTYTPEIKMVEFKDMLKQSRPDVTKLADQRLLTVKDVPLNLLVDYAERDALVTHLMAPKLYAEMEREGQIDNFYDVEMPFLRVLFEMEHMGVTVDVDECNARHLDAQVEICQLEAILKDLADEFDYPPKPQLVTKVTPARVYVNKKGVSVHVKERITETMEKPKEFNPASPIQLREFLFDVLGLKPTGRKTDSGLAATDEGALKMLQSRYPKVTFLATLLRHRELCKRDGTYFQGLPEAARNGVIHTNFNQTGTVTGRLASSKPNLQNQELDTRAMFKARNGMSFIVADYSQAELRVLAHYTQDPKLCKAYIEGIDIHQMTADELRISRRVGKTANFAISYRISPKGLMDRLRLEAGIVVDEKEAQGYIDGWYQAYSNVTPWQEEVLALANENGYVQNLFGRRRRLPHIYSRSEAYHSYKRKETVYPEMERAERQAINFMIQSTVGHFMKIAQVRLHEALMPLGAYQLLQVHDEIVIECPDDHIAEASNIVKEIMSAAVQLIVPITADVGSGKDWKGAKH